MVSLRNRALEDECGLPPETTLDVNLSAMFCEVIDVDKWTVLSNSYKYSQNDV